MTIALPLDLIEKTFLMDIPLSVFSKTPASNRQHKHQHAIRRLLKLPAQINTPNMIEHQNVTLSIGGWINLPVDFREPVSLLLVYKEKQSRQEKAVLIDEMQARGASQVLLSGEIQLHVTRSIHSMSLFCGGINSPSVWAEDLHVKLLHTEEIRRAS